MNNQAKYNYDTSVTLKNATISTVTVTPLATQNLPGITGMTMHSLLLQNANHKVWLLKLAAMMAI